MKGNIYLYLILSLVLILPLPSRADDLSDLREAVAELQSRVDSLQKIRQEIETEREERFGWNLGVFGDVNYSSRSREFDHESFHIHEISLYSTVNYGERLNFLIEIAFEDEEADVERVWAGYTFNDMLTIRAGRFHTALGYWNKTYHHGRQLFATVDRPFFLVFEHDGGVVPNHIVGLEVEGSKAFGAGRLKYEFELGNGPKIDQGMLDPNVSSDDNASKQPIMRLSFMPSAVRGLALGVSATTFEVDTSGKRALDENVYGLDISYARDNLEFITEGFLFRNDDGDGSACYGQLGYRFGPWMPYLRFERLEVEEDDPYFQDLDGGFDRRQMIAGVKYDIDPIRSSIKAQYRRDENQKDYDVFEAQWAFHF